MSLHAQGLFKRFTTRGRGEVIAVNGVSIEVRKGEVVGLLGPNGAGKTTTLRLLTTLLPPDAGTVSIDGIDALAQPVAARSRLGFVPAEAGLPPELSGREVVRLHARIQGVQGPRSGAARADALLDELGAAAFADAPTSTLSTGQKRRIVLAPALIHDPALLLLDEPTDGLDISGRRDVLSRVRRWAEAGKAVLLSSHILGEVEAVCDRAVVLRRGTVVASGALSELRAQARSGVLEDALLALAEDGAEDAPGAPSEAP